MFFALILGAAQAGSLTVTVDADGRTSEVTLDQVATCRMQRFERSSADQLVELGAMVEPLDDGELLVTVDVERRLQVGDDQQLLKVTPALRVADGKRSTLGFTVDGSPAKVTVRARGFDTAGCDAHATRTRRTTTRRTRGTNEPQPTGE